MTREKAKALFKKHYRYAMKLKEGGRAWDREMKRCEQYKRIVLNDCPVKTIRDTAECRGCGLYDACERRKEIDKRFMDAWAAEVYEHGD